MYNNNILNIYVYNNTNTNSGIIDITGTIGIATFIAIQCLRRIQVLAPEKRS